MRAAVCAAGVALLLGVTACKELFANIEEDFSYWASEPVITNFRAASPAQTSPAGVQCVPSATDAVITLTVRNPKNFSFIMPGTGAPADIVRFASGIHDASGTKAPEAGTDYTLSQSGQSTLTLTYKPAFLKRYEQSRANIGASITLYSTDGRKFNQTYSFDLEANTPPPDPAPVEASAANKIALFKTHTPEDGKHYYVLCFKVGGLPGENVSTGVPLHSDLTHVYVSKNGGAETAYPVTLNSGDFVIADPLNTAFIAQTDADPLSNAEATALSGSPQPDTVPSGPWVLYLKTDVPVGGATAKYGIRLFDGKFYSARAEQSIGKRELPAPKVFADSTMNNTAGSGVYTEKGATDASGNEDLNATNSAAHTGSQTDPIPVYSAYGGAVKLTIKKPDGTDYPAGVTVTGSAEKHSADSVSGTASFTGGQSASVTLPSPTNGGGVAVYKVVFKATGEGFDDSNERTLYYKVRREVKAVNGTLPMWHILKKAIEYTSAGGTVVVNGEIKATSASGNYDEITINKNLTIRGNNKTSDILNANTTDGSKPGHRIFSVNSGTLTLKNLTLKGGICPSGAGGGIYIKNNGSSCKMADTDIKNCTVSGGNKLGGAVYVRIDSSLTVESGCVISGNTAPDGKGAAVYLESGGTFNIAGDAKIDEANDVFLEKNADVPYVPSKNAKLTVTAPLTGTHIVAKITPDDYTAGRTIVNAASGVDISAYANRFKITDQNLTTSWKLIHNGTDLILKQATTVIPSGSNAWKTLKEAIEASSVEDDDEFLVQGTITATSTSGDHGAISVTKKITVKGAGSTSVLDADTRSRIFTVENSGKLTLENLTLKNGKADGTQDEDKWGGGILVKKECEAHLKNCTVKACEAAKKGGGICSFGKLTLYGSTIGGSSASDGNKAKQGGGIYFDFKKGRLDVSAGNSINHNKATNTSGATVGGGGVYIQDGTLTLGGTISYNEASQSFSWLAGGGVYVGPKAEFIMNAGATISGNKAPAGAGVYISAYRDAEAGSFTMKGGEISGCTASGSGVTNAQGGVYIKADGDKKGSFTMQGGEITGCTATATTAADGGAVYAESGAVFKMSGGAVITPSTQTNTATKSFNDVYLNGSASNNAKVTVDGTLSNNPAARITPQSYTENTSVLTGAVGSNYTKFTVTPDVKEDGIAQAWVINVAGNLEKSNMEVRYDKLGHYLTASSHAVAEDGIYRFKITGTIPPEDLTDNIYPSSGGQLAKTIKAAGKKVALELPDTIPELTTMYNCFTKCEYLVSLENIPSGVTSIHECFKGCKNLTKAPVIPPSVTDMEHCFDGCTALTQAPTIHPGVTNIKWCFQDCKALISAPVIPQGVTDIYSCFQGCIRLKQVPNIPSSVTNMGQCFKYCAALTQGPDIPLNVRDMYECFEGCTNLKGVKLKCAYSSGGTLFKHVFKDCTSLENDGIKVPSEELQTYQDNAGNMGTTADKFSGF